MCFHVYARVEKFSVWVKVDGVEAAGCSVAVQHVKLTSGLGRDNRKIKVDKHGIKE